MDLNFSRKQFIELWEQYTNKEIRNKLNISEHILYRIKKDLNLPDKKTGRPYKNRKKMEF